MSGPTSWLERQLAEFEHAQEARTRLLMGMAVYPVDSYDAQAVAPQNDVDKDLIVETRRPAATRSCNLRVNAA